MTKMEHEILHRRLDQLERMHVESSASQQSNITDIRYRVEECSASVRLMASKMKDCISALDLCVQLAIKLVFL